MAITPKPKSNTTATQPQDAASAFIAGGGRTSSTEQPAPEPEPVPEAKEGKVKRKKPESTPVMIRFDVKLLERMDRAADKRGMTRSAWVHMIISRALDPEEG